MNLANVLFVVSAENSRRVSHTICVFSSNNVCNVDVIILFVCKYFSYLYLFMFIISDRVRCDMVLLKHET